MVAIGLELSRVTQQINDSRWSIIWSVLFGMLVGLIGTCILVKVLKKILFGLEPYEISTPLSNARPCCSLSKKASLPWTIAARSR